MTRNEFKAGDDQSEDKPPYTLAVDMQEVVNEALAKEAEEVPAPPYKHMHEHEIERHEDIAEAIEPPGKVPENVLSEAVLADLKKRAAEGSVTAQHQLDLLVRDQER